MNGATRFGWQALVLAALALAGATAPAEPADDKITLTGHVIVVDGDMEKPLEHVKVQVMQGGRPVKETKTDGDGYYRVSFTPPGPKLVTVWFRYVSAGK